MRLKRMAVVYAALLLLIAATLTGQVVTASITGTVTQDNQPLPGVTVTIASPNMQGVRSATTDVNGNYNFAAVPAGSYRVTFELQGLQTVTRSLQVGVGQTGRADAAMRMSTVSEAIVITASAPAVLETTEVQTNLQQQTINKLPTRRDVTSVALLAPGTNANGPRNALVMSGATADQNLITVDGAVIQENLRGQPHALFIEDAIQETTVLTGAISAEYGRFTGGVVNSITKSGGNDFHGSYRDNFANPAWTQASAFGEPRAASTLGQVHEATLGGRIIRDRLWFFTAGRLNRSTVSTAFARASGSFQAFPQATDARRLEGKLTGQITPRHSLVGTYLTSPLKATNDCQAGCTDLTGVDPTIQQGNTFGTLHYSGILTDRWLVEGLYSRKTFEFIGFGGSNRDPVAGSPVRVWSPAGSADGFTNAPLFCGVCGNETRNNNSLNLKSTYFWATKGFGTHNIVAGYERWAESRFTNNYQSPTNMILNVYEPSTGFARDPNTGQPVVTIPSNPDAQSGVESAWITYYPVLFPSLGSDLRTKSVFANDKWDLSSHWSFNVGGRFDKNDSVNSLHQPTSKDSNFSPRIGANYDVRGDGRFRLTAGYNVYVGRLAEGVSGASSLGGTPAVFLYEYRGPSYGTLSPHDAAQHMLDWFNSVGGVNNTDLIVGANVPGTSTRLAGSLKSPNVREYTFGGGMQLQNGYLRADYIDRNWRDFYVNVTNLGTGTTMVNGAPANVSLIENTNDLTRKYRAVETQGLYRLPHNIQFGGNYTYSRLRGNAVQENTANGPVAEGGWVFQYPEYEGFAQNNPVGYLSSDQTHKLRLFGSYDLHTAVGNLDLSAIQRYDSGVPYSAVGSIDVRYSPNFYGTGQPGGVQNPGYAAQNAPTSVTYYFSPRGAYRTAPTRSTDLSATYSLPVHGLEAYVEGYVFNVFNQQKVTFLQVNATTVLNTTIRTPLTRGSGLVRFNPFTDTAKECPAADSAAQCTALGANFQIPASFGQPLSKDAYQQPRTYSFAMGVRF